MLPRQSTSDRQMPPELTDGETACPIDYACRRFAGEPASDGPGTQAGVWRSRQTRPEAARGLANSVVRAGSAMQKKRQLW